MHLIAVLERHHGTGNVGLGLLRGYGLKDGAVATTVAHDSHNLIVIGTSPEAMNAAAKELVRVQGGYTLVKGTEVVDTLPLNICGLMSSAPAEELIGSLDEIAAKAHAQGVLDGIDPFISLSFMALPVIPKLRITDMGMFDTEKFEFIKIEIFEGKDMHKLVSQLVVYRNLPADNLLEPLAAICAEFAAGDYNREELTAEIYEQVHKLLDIGTVYGFDKNLWHNYLAFYW